MQILQRAISGKLHSINTHRVFLWRIKISGWKSRARSNFSSNAVDARLTIDTPGGPFRESRRIYFQWLFCKSHHDERATRIFGTVIHTRDPSSRAI